VLLGGRAAGRRSTSGGPLLRHGGHDAGRLTAAQAVPSLTLGEPPAFHLAPSQPRLSRWQRDTDEHLRRSGSDAEWLRGFLAIIGRSLVIPDQLRSLLALGGAGDRAIRRRPWEGELPVDRLTAAPFPKLVISGKHSPAFEAVCVALRWQAQRKARIKVRIRSCPVYPIVLGSLRGRGIPKALLSTARTSAAQLRIWSHR
jgi:hypothetical protein